MSKESKPRDLADQLNRSTHDRPAEYCPGCGYYRVATGEHRTDCTAKPKED